MMRADKPISSLVIREREPLNLESPFEQLDELLTPNSLFYVRSHFPTPQLDADSYRLQITGAVREPMSISLAELKAMPAVTVPATLECAGNGRVFLSPQAPGAQWQLGAVGTAEWTGAPLGALLEQAGMAAEVCEIVLEGADQGRPRTTPAPPCPIRYVRSVTREKAADVVLAYAMNGETLTLDHGFPLRAVAPGQYGMAWVKWLTAVHAVTEPFQGYWQTTDYAYWDTTASIPVRRPLGAMALKSSIARPTLREYVSAGEPYTVFGAAWCGEGMVDGVELSTDDGRSWQEATILDPATPFVWRRWEFLWETPRQPGVYVLRSRARDTAGNVQPERHDERFGSYVICHTVGIEVVVE